VQKADAAGTILTQDFWADSAIFQTCVPAYNLIVWMMWLTYEHKLRQEPDTVRFQLIHIPARLLMAAVGGLLNCLTTRFLEENSLKLKILLHVYALSDFLIILP